MEKYLIFNNQTKNIEYGTIFKVISKNANYITLLGKNLSTRKCSLFEISTKNFSKYSWIGLNEFTSNCEIIGKPFYRTKPLTKQSMLGDTYADSCYMHKTNNNIMLAKYNNMGLFLDKAKNSMHFVEPEYVDKDMVFENQNTITWNAKELKKNIIENFENKAKEVYSEFEL